MQSEMQHFKTEEVHALELDHADNLNSYRHEFFHPITKDGAEKIYLSGNSLGLQPKATPKTMQRELERWQTLASEGHHAGDLPWSQYQEPLRNYLTKIIGATTNEIVLMNALTVNIHLMLVSFYQPTDSRKKILISDPAFPSDRYAVQSFLKLMGRDPDKDILYWKPKPGSHTLNMDDLQTLLQKEGEQIAVIWIEGVNFLTGQLMDMHQITTLGKQYGCKVGFDLAHTIGNVPLKLHDWDVDFAAWCSYKYLNGGPGAIGGCYIHEKYCQEPLLQLAGWYGNDPGTRFKFDHHFIPFPGANRWQISNPPILSMLPLHDSLALFERATMHALRQKSINLTSYLRYLLESLNSDKINIVTPPFSGCQLSIAINSHPQEVVTHMRTANVICDLREPNIMRMAPVPLYNSYHEAWRAVSILKTYL